MRTAVTAASAELQDPLVLEYDGSIRQRSVEESK
jgi:hypothetical protein